MGYSQLDYNVSFYLKYIDGFHLLIVSLEFLHVCSIVRLTHNLLFLVGFGAQVLLAKPINEWGLGNMSIFLIRLRNIVTITSSPTV